MKSNVFILGAAFALAGAWAQAETTIASFCMTGNRMTASEGYDRAAFRFSGTANLDDVAATRGFDNAVNQTGGWGEGSYWQLTLNLSEFTDVKISEWGQRSSNTGPRDFQVTVSFDGGESFMEMGEVYTVPNSREGFRGQSFALGQQADKNENVIVRWTNVSNTSVIGRRINGEAGTSRFTNFHITGISSSDTVAQTTERERDGEG
jgi:hypothetical protein